eukprot:TRINITY_DN7533_c1_g1_i3.p1 TRINITY_DN7533_c1_g1~~TRINITY_DN7533_c1_g1_i3.p1  ORF type:complete len:288 (+),score=-16.24 TRINITY_DN7533_c1_g1_i3:1015-1878(+)
MERLYSFKSNKLNLKNNNNTNEHKQLDLLLRYFEAMILLKFLPQSFCDCKERKKKCLKKQVYQLQQKNRRHAICTQHKIITLQKCTIQKKLQKHLSYNKTIIRIKYKLGKAQENPSQTNLKLKKIYIYVFFLRYKTRKTHYNTIIQVQYVNKNLQITYKQRSLSLKQKFHTNLECVSKVPHKQCFLKKQQLYALKQPSQNKLIHIFVLSLLSTATLFFKIQGNISQTKQIQGKSRATDQNKHSSDVIQIGRFNLFYLFVSNHIQKTVRIFSTRFEQSIFRTVSNSDS